MTIEELEEAFETHNEEHCKFERVENPRHPRPDLCAFLMLHDLVLGTQDMVAGASHDEIWLRTDCDALAAVVTDEQVRDLTRCGVRFSCGDLCMFV